MNKAVLFFCVFMAAMGTGFALDFTNGSEAVQPGNILLSGGLAMGNVSVKGVYESKGLLGFSLAVDYALPFFGLTVGGEAGYLTARWLHNIDVSGIPIMARLGYHPDFGVNNLDVYALAKLGYAIAIVAKETAGGFGFGFSLGGRYFFTDNLAAFAELSFDNYFFSKYNVDYTARKFVMVGATYKFGTGSGRSSGGGSASTRLVLAPESDFSVTLGAGNNTAVITWYNGRGGSIIIPDKIQGMPVVQIAETAFSGIRVTEVVVPEGVTVIGANAFVGCSRLTRITLPTTIKSIGSGAFNGCGELLEVIIPEGVGITWDGNTFVGAAKLLLATQARLRELGYSGAF